MTYDLQGFAKGFSLFGQVDLLPGPAFGGLGYRDLSSIDIPSGSFFLQEISPKKKNGQRSDKIKQKKPK